MKKSFKLYSTFVVGLLTGYVAHDNVIDLQNFAVTNKTNTSSELPNHHHSLNPHLKVNPASCSSTYVYFSPNNQCEQKIIAAIKHASSQILIQCYSFTSIGITTALIDAHHRGIEIKLLYDRSQINQRSSRIKSLIAAGIMSQVDYVPGIAHNKIMIIDHQIVLTGSYNFTAAANLRNAENLLIINDTNTAQIYEKNWYYRYDQSCNNPKAINLTSQQSIMK